MRSIVWLLVSLLVVAGCRSQRAAEPAAPRTAVSERAEVEAAELERWLAAGRAHVLDVRRPDETAQGVIPGAQLIPLDQLPARAGELPRDDAPIVVVCRTGRRSAQAVDRLAAVGRGNLVILRGGYEAWTGPLVPPNSSAQ